MSAETNTAASKKSFMTRVMEDVAAKQAAKESGEPITTSEEVRAKRALKKMAWVIAGTVAATTAVIVIANRMGNEETSTEAEETTSND